VVPQPDRINRVGPAGTLVFMADGPGRYCSVLPSDKPYSPYARHRGWVNLSFLDGHVTGYRRQDIGAGIGEIDRADVRWRVPNSVWLGP
jgi:prepilin-type processing-associated H-X9-DG protein